MFRTKSLSSKEMKTLIDRNRPRQIYKENRNHSLRSLIADKTIKYHKHMQRLVQDVNDSCLISSSKKNNKNVNMSPNKMLKDVSNGKQQSQDIKQFCPFENINEISNIRQEDGQTQYIVVESMPTYANEDKIEEEQGNQDFSHFLDSKKQSQSKSAFRVSLQNEQLNDQNRQLRRQIEHLQQRLETAELIKLQKQSQSQSLRLKIMQLKIQDYKENAQQRNNYFNRFTMSKAKSISVSVQQKSISTQTTDTSQKLQKMQQQNQNQLKQLSIIKPQLDIIKHLIDNLIQQSDINFASSSQTSTYNKIVQLMNRNKLQKQQLINRNKVQLEQIIRTNSVQIQLMQNAYKAEIKQLEQINKRDGEQYEQRISNEVMKYKQMEQKYKDRVTNLVGLLELAQNEIRVLLARLREAKDADVANYKQLITQGHRMPYQLNRVQGQAQTDQELP